MVNAASDYYALECKIRQLQEKADKWDDCNKPFSNRVYIPKLEKEIKQLKEKIRRLENEV